MKIKVKFNMATAQHSSQVCARYGFGERNEGLIVDFPGNTPREAFNAWQETISPGGRLNPFYLTIVEVKD